jgi:hypothetical protein
MTEDGFNIDGWEFGGGSAIGNDLLESRDELHNVTEDGSDITRGNVVDGLLDDWEGISDVSNALWADVVVVKVVLVADAVRDSLLDEGDELGKI